jgi:8-oxo-dGTP diphosphatase
MPEIVNGILLKKDLVLLAKRSDTRRVYAARWSFPGGHVEAGESYEQALSRELQEEIGIVPLEYQLAATLDDPASPATHYHLYAVTRWRGEPAILDNEHSELRWVALSAASVLPELALEGYRAMLRDLAGKYR